MKKALTGAAAVILVAAAWVSDPPGMPEAAADPVLSVDTDSTGNSANTVGTVDACRGVPTGGGSFSIDIVIQDVSSLSGFEADLLYDSSVVTISNKQSLNFFLPAAPPLGLIDFSDSVPDSDGNYRMLLASSGQGSGSGVIMRLTLQPGGDGPTLLELARVKMRDFNNNPVPPSDAQGFYIGPINDGVVIVGSGSCSDYDGDGVANDSDPDDDNDGVHDLAEGPCGGSTPSGRRPERLDGVFAGVSDDSDAQVDEALPAGSETFDCDGDGWTGNQENLIYNDAPSTRRDQDPCGNDGWPADLDPDNKLNIGDINSFTTPNRPNALHPYTDGHGLFNKFGHPLDDANNGTGMPPPDGLIDPLMARWNLDNPPHLAGTTIDIGDLNAINPGITATTARPPMFGEQPAFFTNGGQCPYPP